MDSFDISIGNRAFQTHESENTHEIPESWNQIYSWYDNLPINVLQKIAHSSHLKLKPNEPKEGIILRLLPNNQFIDSVIEVQRRKDKYFDLDVQTIDVYLIPNVNSRLPGSGIIWLETNKYLINGTFSPNFAPYHEAYIHRHIDRLDDLFRQVPPLDKDILVFRGDKYTQEAKVGDIITYKQYVSTTLFLEQLLTLYYDEDLSIMGIIVTKGTKVLFHPAEMQIILPRGTKVMVKLIEKSEWYAFDKIDTFKTIMCRSLLN